MREALKYRAAPAGRHRDTTRRASVSPRVVGQLATVPVALGCLIVVLLRFLS